MRLLNRRFQILLFVCINLEFTGLVAEPQTNPNVFLRGRNAIRQFVYFEDKSKPSAMLEGAGNASRNWPNRIENLFRIITSNDPADRTKKQEVIDNFRRKPRENGKSDREIVLEYLDSFSGQLPLLTQNMLYSISAQARYAGDAPAVYNFSLLASSNPNSLDLEYRHYFGERGDLKSDSGSYSYKPDGDEISLRHDLSREPFLHKIFEARHAYNTLLAFVKDFRKFVEEFQDGKDGNEDNLKNFFNELDISRSGSKRQDAVQKFDSARNTYNNLVLRPRASVIADHASFRDIGTVSSAGFVVSRLYGNPSDLRGHKPDPGILLLGDWQRVWFYPREAVKPFSLAVSDSRWRVAVAWQDKIPHIYLKGDNVKRYEVTRWSRQIGLVYSFRNYVDGEGTAELFMRRRDQYSEYRLRLGLGIETGTGYIQVGASYYFH